MLEPKTVPRWDRVRQFRLYSSAIRVRSASNQCSARSHGKSLVVQPYKVSFDRALLSETWCQVLEEFQKWPADSTAWDEVDDAIAVLYRLRKVKFAERNTTRLHEGLGELLAATDALTPNLLEYLRQLEDRQSFSEDTFYYLERSKKVLLDLRTTEAKTPSSAIEKRAHHERVGQLMDELAAEVRALHGAAIQATAIAPTSIEIQENVRGATMAPTGEEQMMVVDRAKSPDTANDENKDLAFEALEASLSDDGPATSSADAYPVLPPTPVICPIDPSDSALVETSAKGNGETQPLDLEEVVDAQTASPQPSAPFSVHEQSPTTRSHNERDVQTATDNKTNDRPTSPEQDLVTPIGPPPSSIDFSEEPTEVVEIISFACYAARYWISPVGVAEPAPWTRQDFADRVRTFASKAVEKKMFAEMYLSARTLEDLGEAPPIFSVDVKSLHVLVEEGPLASALRTPQRAARLQRYLEKAERGTAIDALCFLEALFPCREAPLTQMQRTELVDLIRFESSALRGLVLALLEQGARGLEPLELLERAAKQPQSENRSPESARRTIRERREAFRKLVTDLWSAAGGKVEQTHCRKAWTRFVDTHVGQLTAVLYLQPERPDDHETWNMEELDTRVSRLESQHAHLANKGGAKHDDRKDMDKAVRRIRRAAEGVLEAVKQHRSTRHSAEADSAAADLGKAVDLVMKAPDSTGVDKLLVDILVEMAKSERPTAKAGLEVSVQWLLQWPDLFALLEDPVVDGEKISVIAISEHRRAVAILLEQPMVIDTSEPEAYARHLLDQGRNDLLARLRMPKLSNERLRTEVHRRHAEKKDKVLDLLEKLRRLLRQADELAIARLISPLQQREQEARELLETHTLEPVMQLSLVQAWLEKASEQARSAVDLEVQHIRAQIEAEQGPRRESMLVDLDAGRFAQVVLAFNENSSTSGPASGESLHLRETKWRRDAERIFRQGGGPHELLRCYAKDLGPLFEEWFERPVEHKQLRALRRSFYEFVSGEAQSGANTRLRILEHHRVAVDCPTLRELFVSQGRERTFVPQLRSFDSLSIVTPRRGLRQGASIVQDVFQSMASLDHRELTVFLTPGLSSSIRQDLLSELRRSSRQAAIIDDIDLCRLVNPGAERPNGWLGLLEIIFEQLPLRGMMPFTGGDGQHLRREMFVGRSEDAKRLALGPEYSRVFSGRKLGKSALLKWVEESYHGKKLPSDNKLHVVYLVVGGASNEAAIVEKIKGEVCRRTRFEPPASDAESPGDDLSSFVHAFIEQRPDESLLVFLDEADSFVEDQIERYDRDREKCLSFRMVKEITSRMDRNELPRVRFVFSGYRVTHLPGGAWANAGGVLRLRPLETEDAALLIAGPLARLGIDASQQAPVIARRCGRQPAVLLKFGERLVERLRRKTAVTPEDRPTVTADDVTDTFNDPDVQNEIWTVVNNNFQGNHLGAVVFYALVREFNDWNPGAGIDKPVERVIQRIRGVDSDLGWLQELDPSMKGEVERQLSDLRQRELLVERGGSGLCRLQFPHHLPILMANDLEGCIRQSIRKLRDLRPSLGAATDLVSQNDMEQVRACLTALVEESLPVALVTVGGHWPESLAEGGPGSLEHRLDLKPWQIVDSLPEGPPRGPGGYLLRNPDLGRLHGWLRRWRRDEGTSALVAVGGLELLRWSLGPEVEIDEAFVETLGLRRISLPRLTWWFERVRCLEFESQQPIERLMHETSGIPLLVRELDRNLPWSAGQSVSPAYFEDFLNRFQKSLPELVTNTLCAQGSGGLTEREWVLFRGLVEFSRMQAQFSIQDFRSMATELCQESGAPLEPAPGDDLVLELLKLTGLVQISDEHIVSIPREDQAHRIVEAVT